MLAGILHRLRLGRLPATSLSSSREKDLVKVRGQAMVGEELLRAPLTGRFCVFYAVEVSEWFNGNKTPLLQASSEARFRLEDQDGNVLVDPRSADLYLPTRRVVGHSSECLSQIRALLKSHNLGMLDHYGELRSLAFRESIIAAKDTITVLGTVRLEAHPKGSAGYRDQPQAKILGSRPGQMILLGE